MPSVNPLRLLVKLPVPVPSLVLVDNATVGDEVVPHTTPLAVTGLPPSLMPVPPELAEDVVMELTAVVVVMVGRSATLMFSVELALPVALLPVCQP